MDYLFKKYFNGVKIYRDRKTDVRYIKKSDYQKILAKMEYDKYIFDKIPVKVEMSMLDDDGNEINKKVFKNQKFSDFYEDFIRQNNLTKANSKAMWEFEDVMELDITPNNDHREMIFLEITFGNGLKNLSQEEIYEWEYAFSQYFKKFHKVPVG